MKFSDYRCLVLSDLYRVTRNTKFSVLMRHILAGTAYKYIFWMRTCQYARKNAVLKISLFPVASRMLRRYTYRFGISIPFTTEIGRGFYIGHFGCIVINPDSKIGENCTISQGVTIGQTNRGKNKGCPTIGNNVYIGPGAKVIGAVHVGHDVAIGANCVVTKDVPDRAVVVGIPGRVISYKGSEGYVNNTDYGETIG